ncbi:MAG: ShlB/FhaC/HecB family hemolysin secretion/activation protein [Ferruginibacter sp.]
MKYIGSAKAIIVVILIVLTTNINAQQKDTSNTITIPASNKYERSKAYQRKWGTHYRQEWATPVTFKKVNLDTLAGGLTPYQTGGGRQSKSVRLRDKDEREYVLRSIDKSFGKALPEIIQGTFIESLANDQVTIAHPYSALTVAPLAEAAGIYHTNPQIFYVPKQTALRKFSDSMGNTLYLFEKRADEDWKTAANFGNSTKIVSTEEMLEKNLKDNDNLVDQEAYVRARIFDMFIGDWGRHEDQWRWATFKNDKKTKYVAIPRDRDQTYTVFDGSILKRIIRLSGALHLQTFDSTIKNVVQFNFPARHLDFHLANQITIQQWVRIAQDLQKRLTDKIIDDALMQLPPEVYALSGPAIAAKLKSRRGHLAEYAQEYATFLSKEVDITGSEDDEFFEIKKLNENETEIKIYKITNEGIIKDQPIYHRVFNKNETEEIRLYGIYGKDQFKISGNVSNSIKLRLIGGAGKDSYINESVVNGNRKSIRLYDDRNENTFQGSGLRKHLSKDSAIHFFDYSQFDYDSRGIKPLLFYDFEDRIYVGIGYKIRKQGWRKKPFAQEQSIDVKYSLSQKAFSSTYKATFTSAIGKWDFKPLLNFDAVRWNNYAGLGNETIVETAAANYNRLRTKHYYAELALHRLFKNYHKLTFSPFFQSVQILNDSGSYLSKEPISLNSETFEAKHFAGATLSYVFQKLNDSILPVKGISFIAWSNFTGNIHNKNTFTKFGSVISAFLPLSKKFGIHVKVGGATLSGTPELYQLNTIGGSSSLRGYHRDRFYGRSSFYNQNELRWITNFKTYLVNGKIGLFALYDIGRVWLDNENSNTWHPGYGGGVLFSPFNKLTLTAAYAIAPSESNIHLGFIKHL